MDIRHLEEATNSLIYTESAFGANYDQAALYPDENFVCASLNAPSNRDYSFAILQGVSSDITNLDTEPGNSAHLEFLKQSVFVACQNMISAAQNIILQNPSIERVLILGCAPRFDTVSFDPAQLKSNLAQYANKVLSDELERCDAKAKITIGYHSLPNKLQQNIYGHPARKGYDGIHLHGPDGRNFYTRSVCNILQSFLRKYSRESHNHVIPRVLQTQDSIASSSPRVPVPKTPARSPTLPTARAPPSHTSPSFSQKNPQNSVVIDIEMPDSYNVDSDNVHYLYSVPTSNQFNLLGN